MSVEVPKPNWDGIVLPIIQVKLGEARIAQVEAEEVARMQKEAEARSVVYAQECKARLEETIAKRRGLLESLHARELLEDLNASQNIWRGFGTLKKNQLTARDSSESTAVEFSLEADYMYWGSMMKDTGGFGDQAGESSVPCLLPAATYTKVGIFPANLNGEEERLGGQGIYLEGAFRLLRGSKFFNGNVLYVIDSDACLEPIEGADRFNEGDTRLSHRKNLSAIEAHDERMAKLYGMSTDSIEHLDDNGVFLLEAEHSQASEILVEVLKRSCIYRAKGNLLPFQLVEKGNEFMREAGLGKQPAQRLKGFWGRFLGR